jgi:hypothetical protein
MVFMRLMVGWIMRSKKRDAMWTDKNTIAILWGVEDVQTQATIRGLKLTKKECRKVLEACLNSHDATLGLSWDILDHHIIVLFGDRIGKEAA